MSGAPHGPNADGSGAPGSGSSSLPGGSDPSMEDILASIRRILSEDENAGGKPAEPARHEPVTPVEPHSPEVFNLDASMIVDEQPQRSEPVSPEGSRLETVYPEPIRPEPFRAMPPEPPPAPPPAPAQQLAVSPQLGLSQPSPNASPDTLVAPAAAAAAAMSIGSLRRTLEMERQPSPRGAGITVEEMVREELRPMLKTWLDENLAPIVERVVRAEIERVVGRSSS